MDKTLHKFTSLEEMKAAELRDWQKLPGYDRINAAADLSMAAFGLKGAGSGAQPEFQRTLVRLQQPEAPVISREDLIAAKLAAGRPQDIVDAAAIREAGTKKATT